MNQSLFHHGINLLNSGIGHRQTADGNIPAMHHDEASRPVQGAVIGIRIPDVERQMVIAPGIEPGRLHFIKTFRRLPVPLLLLGAQFSGPCGNRIALGNHVAFRFIRFHLQFQNGILLHNTQNLPPQLLTSERPPHPTLPLKNDPPSLQPEQKQKERQFTPSLSFLVSTRTFPPASERKRMVPEPMAT